MKPDRRTGSRALRGEVIVKRGRGRPTLYRPEMCEQVEELGTHGLSLCQIGERLGVSHDALEDWARVNPEFGVAIARARASAMAWWENAGQQGLTNKFFNAQLWSRSMAARFPQHYRESKDVKLTVETNVSERLIAGRKRITG